MNDGLLQKYSQSNILLRKDGLPDFERLTYAVLGLPFDALTLHQAVAIVEASIRHKKRCFISTPNVNFAVAARRDPKFRNSVLQSDLVLADGQPIVWSAKLTGVPIHHRVPGSGLFECLMQNASMPIKVYFFGGPDGMARAAHESINKLCGRLKSVGFYSPGFGSVADMSSPDTIREINDAAPDFLVVALGGRKGQEWIVANLHRLQVPVVSHLGAVVNFVAGSVKRAPWWAQRFAAEWLWRISQEPQLWRRYWNDGRQLIVWLVRDLFLRTRPLCWDQRKGCHAAQISACDLVAGVAYLSLVGKWLDSDAGLLRSTLLSLNGKFNVLQLNVHDLLGMSPRIHAMLLQCEGVGIDLRFIGSRKTIVQLLNRSGCSHWISR